MSIRKLLHKLEVAREEGAIVCTTPSAVKSLFLKYLDLHQSVEGASPLLRCPVSEIGEQAQRAKEMGQLLRENAFKADELAKILNLWKGGVALLDEVDVLLHPLRSELNFPIGPKLQLESHDFRWDLPIHMIDALFYPTLRRVSLPDFVPDADSTAILTKIVGAIERGVRELQIQPSPHLTLLSQKFYDDHLKDHLARWAAVWLCKQEPVSTALMDLPNALKGIDQELQKSEREVVIGYVQAKPADIGTVQKSIESKHPKAIKMLNLAKDWVTTMLFHVFSKINRVSYGLLQDKDMQQDESIPKSRQYLAVPFVALEVPSRSSEFAHPEVLIGLSFLAFRYEGLRHRDLKQLMQTMIIEMQAQPGPFSQRPARARFNKWIADAALDRERAKKPHVEVLELEMFQPEKLQQMKNALELLGRHPPVIIFYLTTIVYPAQLRKQVTKMQASGVDLGGDMLFGTRLGFSGTPSDLLPTGLTCHFEPGSEAQIIRWLTRADLVTSEVFALNRERPENAVDELIEHIATAKQANGKPYNALIDTGALITGKSNEDVARDLLRHTPAH
jgi:hypothetical protein